ncbi:hypothetical protein B0H16DRAFT_1883000 [Mycena metata]|uniref:Uncharacterized protein n=1 Tax=Mycena metata TaxID=1033252 RepID=A0AAD7NLI4_9AGAR|nr:hypothetical protein B0H16DRAFT_1883000 [Mycena metata]
MGTVLLHDDIAQVINAELRVLVVHWISSLVETWIDALPPQFPLDDFSMRKTFQWRPKLSPNPVDTVAYRVSFQHGKRSGHSRGIWTLKSGECILGAFEIPREVYAHPLRSFPITAQLVLEAMRDSVASACAVGLNTELLRRVTPDGPVAEQHFHFMKMPEWEFLREVAVYRMQDCRECGMPLPHPGPDFCAAHLG